MDDNVWMVWYGKKIFLRTIANRIYVGRVKAVQALDLEKAMLSIIDARNKLVMINSTEIQEIKEED